MFGILCCWKCYLKEDKIRFLGVVMNKKWGTYEEVATYLLNEFSDKFGLSRVEGKQQLKGIETNWEIDAKGVKLDGKGFLIIECRRFTTSKQNQGNIAKLAYSIIDAGAKGGILVSPLGIQSGGQKIAKARNIISVELDENSNNYEYTMRFLNKLMIGVAIEEKVNLTDSFDATITRVCKNCGEKFTVKTNEMNCLNCS